MQTTKFFITFNNQETENKESTSVMKLFNAHYNTEASTNTSLQSLNKENTNK